MLSEKENTFCCLHTNATDAVVLEKQTLDQDITPTKPTKPLIVCLAQIYQIIRQVDQASQYGNSLIISQLHLNKKIKPKRLKENQGREICDERKKELKKLDHNHKYENAANRKAVIIGDPMLNGIDQYGLSNESFKVRVKNHPGVTTDICDHLKTEIRKKPDIVIIHTRTSDLTSNTKSLENFLSLLQIQLDLNHRVENWLYQIL